MALNGGRDFAVNYVGSAAGLKGPSAAARAAVGSVGKAAETSSKRSGRALSVLKGVARGIGKVVKTTAVGAGLAIGAIASTAIVKGFQRLDKLDQATAKLEGLKMSAKAASKVINGPVLKAVKGTAFGLDEAASTAAGAMASGITSYKGLQKYLTLVGDAATLAGTSFNAMGQIMNKVQGQGKLTGDVINQMAQNGLYVVPMLAKAFGKTQTEIRKMVSQGKISSKQFQQVLEKNIGGAAQKSGKTFQGAWKNMMAALSRLGAGFLQGVFPQIKGALGDVTGLLDRMAPVAKKAGDWLGKAFAKAWPVVKKFMDGLDFTSWSGFFASLQKGGSGALGSFGKGLSTAFTSIKSSLTTLKPAFSAFMAELPKLGQASAKIGSAGLKVLTTGLGFLADHVDTIIKYMPAIVAGFVAWRVASTATAAASRAVTAANIARTPVLLANNILRLKAATLENRTALATDRSTVATTANNTANKVGMLTRVRGVAVMVAQKTALIAGAAATKIAAAGQWLLNAALSANPIGIVVLALAALVGGLIYAYKHSEKFRKIVQGAWKGIRKVVGAVAKWFSGTLWPGIKKVWAAITKVNNQLWDTAKKVWKGIKDTIATVLNTVRSTNTKVWNGIKSTVSRVWNSIKSAVSRAVGAVRSTISRGLSAVRSVNSRIWNGIRSTISGAWSSIRSAAANGVARVRLAVVNGFNRVVSAARGLPGRIVRGLGNMGSLLYSAGTQLIQGLINGIAGMAQSVASKAKSVVTGAISAAKGALGIHSPSRVFAKIGEQTGAGMVRGLAGMRGEVAKAGQGLADAARPDLRGVPGVQRVPSAGRPMVRIPAPAAPDRGIDEAELAAALARALNGLNVDLTNGRLYVEHIVADAAKDAAGVF